MAGITTVTGIGVSGAAGSTYSINGGDFTAQPGGVANGDAVRVRHTSSASLVGTRTTTTLTIGGVTADFVSSTPESAPGAPIIGLASAGDGQVSVTFSPPESDGLSPITGYTATSSPGSVSSSGCTASPCTVAGLTNSTTYTFTVTATNALGTSAPSAASNAVTPRADQAITFGAAPTVVVGSAGLLSATGGASGNPVTFTSQTTGICTVSGSNGSTVTGVGVGTCTIAANQAGSAAFNAAPQVTQSFSVGQGSQTITFGTAPTVVFGSAGTVSATGGASGNPVTFSSQTTGVCTTSGSNGSTITGVGVGMCTIAANQAGTTNYAAAAQVTQSFLVNAVLPGAPVVGAATAGNASASVSFTAPSNGGSVITGYTATSTPGGVTSSGCTASPCTFTGLTNGTAYTFTVTATNSVGTGPASAPSNSVTPATVPGAPTIGTATAGNAQATVTFTPPASNGGSAITGYTATSSPGGFSSSGCTASPCTVTGLSNGTAYTFTVTASNSVGTGAASAASNSVTPVTLPGAPIIDTATAGDGQASVSFSAPASNGGSAIIGYTATSTPGGRTSSGCTASPCIVTGLNNGTAYTFTVTATNAVGTGPASAPSIVVIPTQTSSPPVVAYTPGTGAEVLLAGAGTAVGDAASASIAVSSQTAATGTGSATLGCSVQGGNFGLLSTTVGPITAGNPGASIGVTCSRTVADQTGQLNCTESSSPGGGSVGRSWPLRCPGAGAVAPVVGFSPTPGDTIAFDSGTAGTSPPRLISLQVTQPGVGAGSLSVACSITPATGFSISNANQTLVAGASPSPISLTCERSGALRSATLTCARTASPGGGLGDVQWPLSCPQAVSQSTSVVKVGQRLSPRGREVSVPVSIRGNGQTTRMDVIVQFDDTQLSFERVQAVAPATCARVSEQSGSIGARQIRVTTPTSNTPFPTNLDRAFCDIVLVPKATASGGFTGLPVVVSTCEDGVGNNLACTTEAGSIGINSLETNPRPGSTLSMSEEVGRPVARDALLIRNVGTATMTGTCSMVGTSGFAVVAGANYSVAPGGTVSVGLECTLPGNPDVPVTGGLLTCTTPTDTALGDLFWSLSCDARRASEPVPESQLRRENLAANAQFGASGANLPNGGGASMAVGAPGAGSDFSGEVYLLGMGPQIAGKSAQRPYALRDITVKGIVSAPRQKNELPDLCFGRSIATTADGARMAVGAPGRCSASSTSTDAGKVVIYQRPAEGWSEAYGAGFGSSQLLTAPLATGGVLPQEFGAAVSYMPDGRLLVGAPGADSGVADDVGQAYLYTASGGALATTPTRIASPQGGVFAGRFGAAVAAGSEFLIIGAPGEGAANSRRGMAYVVNFANGEPLPAAPVTTTTTSGDNTGRSVLVVGKLVFVGVPGADTSVGTNSGAVRVFRRNADGSTLEVARLIPQPPAGGAPSAGANQALGASLSSNGVTLFAGAPDATENGNARQGRTYAYRIDDRWASTTTSLGDVPATAVLINVGGSANEAFGSAVVVGPGSALIGAPESSLDNGAVQKVGRADLFGMEELFRSGFER